MITMKAILISALIAISITSFGQDMKKYLSETKEMVMQKKYKEALERYVWFHNHAIEYDKAMSGVRLSFALKYWKDLADVYPPAMTALIEIRDIKTKTILDSNASIKLFADVVGLNRTLGEENKTIELFESIRQQHPDKALQCWFFARDVLFNAKRYDILKNYIGNPINEFAVLKSQYDLMNSLHKSRNMESPELKLHSDNNFAIKCLELIEFSIAVNDLKSAKEIREQALTIVSDLRLRDYRIE
jgi:hypothetical protein